MVRQYRIERIQGLEFLVCEVYDRYFWNQGEYQAFAEWMKTLPEGVKRSSPPYNDFRVELNEWCDQDHDEKDTFFGLTEPIPALSPIPCVVLRGLIVNGVLRQFSIDTSEAVTSLLLEDEFHRFVRFTANPHWRNTVAHNVERYGTLFTSEDDR